MCCSRASDCKMRLQKIPSQLPCKTGQPIQSCTGEPSCSGLSRRSLRPASQMQPCRSAKCLLASWLLPVPLAGQLCCLCQLKCSCMPQKLMTGPHTKVRVEQASTTPQKGSQKGAMQTGLSRFYKGDPSRCSVALRIHCGSEGALSSVLRNAANKLNICCSKCSLPGMQKANPKGRTRGQRGAGASALRKLQS